MFLYLREQDAFELIPETLRSRFGPPQFVMELALTPERKLARADVAVVMENLADQGFHLQLPPDLDPDLYHGNDL